MAKTKQEYLDRYYQRVATMKEYLGGKCVQCGSTEKLQFDHIDRDTKLFTITNRAINMSFDNIKEELDKCQLLCTECHKVKTRKDLGWKEEGTHGTLNTYTKLKCRCDLCREVWNKKTREYKRKYRLKQKVGRLVQ